MCECKELIDKGICDKGSIWNPSNCECECNKSCDIDEYLDYQNCKCKKKLVDKLVERSSAEKCTENIDEVKIANENEFVCSYTICVALIAIALAISIGIVTYFSLFSLVHKKDVTRIRFGTGAQWNCTQTTI